MLELALAEFIERQVEVQLGNTLNTNMPARIVSYDAATNRAVVKPDLPKRLASEEPLEASQIVEVPVIFPASSGGKASITFPLKPGDGGMLSIQQRSIEGWLNGNNAMPDDPRQFDLSDSVFIPGLQSTGIVGHADNVVLKLDGSSVSITKNNSIVVDAPQITMGNAGNARAFGKIDVINSDMTLARNPSSPMHATTKSYVDSKIGTGGGQPGPPGPEGPPGPQGPPGDSWGSEAPINSLSYGRMNANWTRVLAITNDVFDGGNF